MNKTQIAVNKIILPYLSGKPLPSIEARLKNYALTKNVFQATHSRGKSTDGSCDYEQLSRYILEALNITEKLEQDNFIYASDNIYQLLILLYRSGYHHVDYLIDMIDKTKPKQLFPIWFTPSVIASIAGILVAIFDYQQHERFMRIINAIKDFTLKSIEYFRKIFSVAKNVAYAGIAFNALRLVYCAFTTWQDEKLTTGQKGLDLLYYSVSSSCVIAGYALTVALNGAMPLVAAGLMITSSSLAIVKGAIYLWHAYKSDHNLEKGTSNMSALEHAQLLRNQFNYRYKRAALAAEMGSATIMTAAVSAWCLFPASIPLIAACMGIFVVVPAFSYWLQDLAKYNYADQLQTQLNKIDELKSHILPAKQTSNQQILTEILKRLNSVSPESIPQPKVNVSTEDNAQHTTISIPAGFQPGTEITVTTKDMIEEATAKKGKKKAKSTLKQPREIKVTTKPYPGAFFGTAVEEPQPGTNIESPSTQLAI